MSRRELGELLVGLRHTPVSRDRGPASGLRVTTITDAIATLIARAHREHRRSVEAAAQALLIPLGVEGLRARASLRIGGDPVAHELLVDGVVIWRGVRGPRGWEATWIVPADSLG